MSRYSGYWKVAGYFSINGWNLSAYNEYVFYVYAQEDGRNLVSGPNSSIPLSDNRKELSTISEEARLDRESILEKVRNGVANQIETDREKRTSKDDISVK